MPFALSKCRVLLQDWISSKMNLVLAEEQPDEVDRFSYFSSCISFGGGISNDMSSRIQKARLALGNLRHLWCQSAVTYRSKVEYAQ